MVPRTTLPLICAFSTASTRWADRCCLHLSSGVENWMHLVSGVSSSDDGDTGSVTPPAGSAPKCDECLAGRGTRKFGWGNRNIRFKTSTGVSVEFTPSDLAGKPTLMFADAGNFTRIEYRQVSQHIPNQFKLNYYHTEYQHQIKTLHLEFTWDHGYLHSWVLRKCSPYSIDVTNENALWDWGQGKDYTAGMQGKDRPAIHRAFDTYKQIEINHKSYIWVWKKLVRVRFTPLIYYPVSWVMSTSVNFHPHLSACVIIFFTRLLHFCQIRYFRLGDHFKQEHWRWWYNNIFVQVLRSPRRVGQRLPSAPAVRFVCSGSESNQLSMINMENSHWNHSFLWETTVRLCIKPWVNKPPPLALLVTDQMVELK